MEVTSAVCQRRQRGETVRSEDLRREPDTTEAGLAFGGGDGPRAIRAQSKAKLRALPSDLRVARARPESPVSHPPPSTPQRPAEDVARLFREHNHSLVSFLALRLRSVQEAKEVAQEAYVRLLQLDRDNVGNFLRAYLFRIASNLAVDRVRRRITETRITQTELFELFCDPNPDPERCVLARDELQRLAGFLEELPDAVRQAFLLFRVDGQSQEAIAAQLGVSDRMVRKYITRALVHCRLRLDGVGLEEARRRLK